MNNMGATSIFKPYLVLPHKLGELAYMHTLHNLIIDFSMSLYTVCLTYK